MIYYRIFLVFFAVTVFSLKAEEQDFTLPFLEEIECVEAEYPYNSAVSQDVWDILKPYFLPENHPIKSQLDKMFKKKRITANKKSIEKAGFTIRRYRDKNHFAVLFHDKFESYALKVFTDESENEEWSNFLNRVIGANIIREAIDRHNYNKMFTVPKKWIYPLPKDPPSTGPHPKNFILVTERMDVCSGGRNFSKWESSLITHQMLDAFYILLQEEGLNDSIYPFNVPYGRDGRLTFIDTEHYHNWPIYFEKITKYLSQGNKGYWQNLISNGGPK